MSLDADSPPFARLAVPEPASPTLPFEPLPLTEKDEQDAAAAKEDAPAFDDEEDAKLIEESRRRLAKKKGLNPRADKSKAGKKARAEKDE